MDRGESKNGTYTIKPTLSKHSFKVQCEFVDSKGYTIIKPTNLNETGNVYPPSKNQRCEDANCFTQSVDYGLDIEQLKVSAVFSIFDIFLFKALTQLSTHCQQAISHNCNNNPLTGFSSWSDINNVRNQYWHGDHRANAVGCACLLDNSCGINLNHNCNCDTYKMNADDSGFLTSKDKLPVMQLHYGGSVSEISRIIYNLDALICTGKSGTYPSEATKAALNKLFNEDISIVAKINDLQDEFVAFRNESQEITKVMSYFL